MKRFFLGLAVVLLVPLSLQAQDAAKKKKADQKEKTAFQKLNDEYQKDYQEISAKFRKAKTDKERNELRSQFAKMSESFTLKYIKAAKVDPKSDSGFNCLTWVLQRNRSGKLFEESLDLLAKHQVANNKITQITSGLVYSTSAKATELLKAVVKNHPDKTVKGQTSIILAGQLKRIAEIQGNLKLYAEAQKVFEEAANKYGNIRTPRGTVAKASEVALKDMRGPRALGKIAPEIEAEDLDSENFKLSDYRGKVVMIDFWGNW